MPISVFESRREQLFPVLSTMQVERLRGRARVLHVSAGEELLKPGDRPGRLYVVMSGRIDVFAPTHDGERLLRTASTGEFTGEIGTLLGTAALDLLRVREGGDVLVLEESDVRHVLQTDEELSEILLRAFILRRVGLVSLEVGRVALIGSRQSADTLRLKEFLTRNAQPFADIDVEAESSETGLIGQLHVRAEDAPLLLCRNGQILRNPSNHEVAVALGMNPDMDATKVYDVIVIGAGPAGLAAAVYATTEGLSTVVIETLAPGGQAGSSSRIENYLGFPNGISGPALAGRALLQSQKFGALVSVATSAVRIDCGQRPYRVALSNGSSLRAHTVIIATGAQYRQLSVSNLSDYIGLGVYYAATHLEARLCQDQEVVVVGGGNSAGQAAMFLAASCRHVHMVVRSNDLTASMSRYLIRRIEETPRISVHLETEIIAMNGDGRLESIVWRDHGGHNHERSIRHVFLMTGADPRTDWLRHCLALDDKNFVRTGPDLIQQDSGRTLWRMQRAPHLLETSVPAIFAVGDVRSGSVKRVASAVGEGSICVQFVHQVLPESKAIVSELQRAAVS